MLHLLEYKTTRHKLYKYPIYTERGSEDCHKMSSVDHLHVEPEMLKVREHSELLSAHNLVRCLEPENVGHSYHHKGDP